MKKSHLPFNKQLMLLMAALFLTGAAFSQNTLITDVSGSVTTESSAVLNVHSNSLGMLVPRLGTAPSSPATGLLYYSTGTNSFNYYNGSSWAELSYGNLWSRTGTTDTYLTNMTDNLLIGTSTAGLGYKFYVFGASSQQSRFDGQVKVHSTAVGPLLADINDNGGGNGIISLYNGGLQTTQILAAGPSYFMGGNVGIGIPVPFNLLHLQDGSGTTFPQLQIDNFNGTQGNVSIGLLQSAVTPNKSYALGISEDNVNTPPTDYNFKICNSSALTPPGYAQTNTMMEIHDENQKAGIIDFNHQSRARTYLNSSQAIPTHTWQPIDFDATDYDEHGEFTTGSGSVVGGPPVAYFTATEEGYYQVNSRTEFFLGEMEDNWWVMQDAYVSIAIYKADLQNNWSMYAQGNNLQIGQIFDPNIGLPIEDKLSFKNNNAPNVSDVVYLQAGEKIAIYAWQSSGINLFLITGKAKTYVSIHKES